MACLFLDFRFYLAKLTIEAEKETAKIKGQVVPFQTKLVQAWLMLISIGHYFPNLPLLAVTDSQYFEYVIFMRFMVVFIPMICDTNKPFLSGVKGCVKYIEFWHGVTT